MRAYKKPKSNGEAPRIRRRPVLTVQKFKFQYVMQINWGISKKSGFAPFPRHYRYRNALMLCGPRAGCSNRCLPLLLCTRRAAQLTAAVSRLKTLRCIRVTITRPESNVFDRNQRTLRGKKSVLSCTHGRPSVIRHISDRGTNNGGARKKTHSKTHIYKTCPLQIRYTNFSYFIGNFKVSRLKSM